LKKPAAAWLLWHAAVFSSRSRNWEWKVDSFMQYWLCRMKRERASHGLGIVALVFAQCCLGIGCFAQSAKPVITKIDPPNWFTELPEPMLLVHGEHLENTVFAARHTKARIIETRISSNGHWAFLSLDTKTAKPGEIDLVARNSHGSTTVEYELSPRRDVAEQPKGFSSADVMYLIMPDRFADGEQGNDRPANAVADDRGLARAYHGGDLRGIEDHLDYLQQMGVTTIWTTPLYDNSAAQSGQTYHGYSATDMYAVDPHFGTMADYRALVEAAHARGMKVVLDTVPNHVGPAHPWVKDEPTPDWFHGTAASHIKVDDDFASVTDPTASAARRHVLLDGWFADALPDMNQSNLLVAQYLIQNAAWWIESAGIDGLRIDTFPYVPRSFWHEYNGELHALYPHMSDVGEVFNHDPHITSFFAGGRANTGSDGTYDTLLDTPFDFPMFFALRGALTHHKPMSAIADVLREDSLYPHPERLVTFLGNHDTKRFLSEPGANPAALRLAFGLLATMRGMPQLYYGDELAMTGGDDPDNRKDFPGGFAGDKADAFTQEGRTQDQEAMHAWVQELMQLRKHAAVLQSGQLQVLSADADSLVFARAQDVSGSCATTPAAARYLVVANNTATAKDVTVTTDANAMTGCRRFSSMLHDGAGVTAVSGGLTVHLPAQQIAVFRAQR
jgi:glycosidase